MSISFIHTADVHIGMKFTRGILDSSTSKNKRMEIMDTFLNIVERCKLKNIDFLLIAGDLFEDELCTIADLKMINDSFKEINKTKVIMISGNHDYLNEKSLYNLIDWNENVYIMSNEKLDKLTFEEYNTEIWGLSWYEKEKSKENFENIKINKDKNNILLLHADLLDKNSKYMPIDKKIVENLGFDYLALGHIHKHQCIGGNICYPGTPEPLDFGELGEHGIIEGVVDKNSLDLNFIPIAKRNYHNLYLNIDSQMTYNDILNQIIDMEDKDNFKKDFFRIILEGFIDKDMKYKIKELEYKLKDDFYFLKIIDNTKEDYDLESMLRENKDNIIGKFIKEMKEKDLGDEIINQALTIGMEELLKEKGM
ncbi:metallophosphoesterase family protein [Senegalia sp. (in: firmicutes)]|uniref:metallophosphoesterase family protein n=1 Tax=Senegalia sp. (in: firmicutes) TaxID=1924098 RepID=UPI003F9D3E01